MEKYIIKGGTRLHGGTEVCGSKNAILPILAASLLTSGTSVIHNVPLLKDVMVMTEVLAYLGVKVKWEGKTLILDAAAINSCDIPERMMRKLRASNLIIGPLLSRCRYVRVPFPGGCAIGSRPMDYHLKGLQQLNAEIQVKSGCVEASTSRLEGTDIYLDFPSVGATENLLMAAVLAEGKTIIRNAAREPEVSDLAKFLTEMGASIQGVGTDILEVIGVSRLHDVEHTVIPDRIEAGTFMIAAAITNGDIVIRNAIAEHVEPVSAKLREAGITVLKDGRGIRVKGQAKFKAVDFKTLPYPGFPTDMQPQMMALLTIAQGTSVIAESIFENRFKHADELRRMGADVKIESRFAVVKGVNRLSGTIVEASDLRAGAALVLAGLAAEGVTVVEQIHHIDRGYHKLEKKYASLGARIVRVINK